VSAREVDQDAGIGDYGLQDDPRIESFGATLSFITLNEYL